MILGLPCVIIVYIQQAPKLRRVCRETLPSIEERFLASLFPVDTELWSLVVDREVLVT